MANEEMIETGKAEFRSAKFWLAYQMADVDRLTADLRQGVACIMECDGDRPAMTASGEALITHAAQRLKPAIDRLAYFAQMADAAHSGVVRLEGGIHE